LRAVLLLSTVLMLAADAAAAGSLRISGTVGYLSEWEVNGELIETISADERKFSGPLVWKHVGLCSANGPQEKTGAISLQIFGSGALSRIHATLWLEETQCEFNAGLSDGSTARMDCSNAKGIPLKLTFN
jgi:hypothetical protein